MLKKEPFSENFAAKDVTHCSQLFNTGTAWPHHHALKTWARREEFVHGGSCLRQNAACTPEAAAIRYGKVWRSRRKDTLHVTESKALFLTLLV